MIFVLLAALAVGVACYFGIDALGTAAIDRWYLSDDAIAARNLEHARSLQEYVSARGVSSRDTLAIEQWSRGEKKANVIVYQAEGDPYEAGSWGTSELLDDTTQSDIADLGYSFFTLISFDNSVSHLGNDQLNGSDSVIVAWDHIIKFFWITVGIYDTDQRNAQSMSFLYADVLFLRIYDEDCVWELLHILDTAQVLL